VGVLGKVAEKVSHINVKQGVAVEHLSVDVPLFKVGKLSFDEQVGDFDEVTLFDQVFNVVASVAEDSLLTIYVTD